MLDIYDLFRQELGVIARDNLVSHTEFVCKVVCPTCKGEGFTLHRDLFVHDSAFEKHECHNCDGSGLVSVKVSLEKV